MINELRYEAPKTLEAAIALLGSAEGLSRILAGGSDLLVQMRSGRVEPALIIDVKGIPEMTTISAEQAKPWIDAAVADPRTEIAALKLAAVSGYLPRQEVLIPVLLRERDARKSGVLRQVDATRYAQLLLIRQPQLSVERLAAARRQLSPADAGFSALGLVLFAATDGCSTSPETP